MKDFILWLISENNKPFGRLVGLSEIVSEIKENHVLIHLNNASYMDAEMEFDIPRILLRQYIIKKFLIFLVTALVAVPIFTALCDSYAITGIAALILSYEAPRIAEKIVN